MMVDFVGQLHRAGVRVFIVHARNAWLKGLSPKENREVPPLRHATVHELKRAFPAATVVVNGGIETIEDAAAQLHHCDGVMIGRAAYHAPALLAQVDPAPERQPAPWCATCLDWRMAARVRAPGDASSVTRNSWPGTARMCCAPRRAVPDSRPRAPCWPPAG